jgi:hypothetical protein
VADSIGKPPAGDVKAFVDRHPELIGTIAIPHIDQPFHITRAEVERVAGKFLLAVQDAGKIYRTSPRPRARRISSPKSRWMKPTARRRRRNC